MGHNVRQCSCCLIIQPVVRSFAALTGSIEDAARDGPCAHGKLFDGSWLRSKYSQFDRNISRFNITRTLFNLLSARSLLSHTHRENTVYGAGASRMPCCTRRANAMRAWSMVRFTKSRSKSLELVLSYSLYLPGGLLSHVGGHLEHRRAAASRQQGLTTLASGLL